jgi:hypothetical protein
MTMQTTEARFWMVARQPTHRNARTEPKVRYATLEAARDAARKLACENDAPFVILEVADIVHPSDPSTGRLL